MALAVDAGGRQRASSSTGSVYNNSRPTGTAADLREILGLNVPTSRPSGGISALTEIPASISPTGEAFQPAPQSWQPVSSVPQWTPQVSYKPPAGLANSTMPVSFGDATPTWQDSQTPQALTSSQPDGMAAATGNRMAATEQDIVTADNDLYDALGIDPRHTADLVGWEQRNAEAQNRPVRTTNLFDEEYEDKTQPTFSWDSQLDYVGNTPMNDVYLRAATSDESHPISMDDAWAIAHRPQSIPEDEAMRATRNVSPDLYANAGKAIDDGSSYDYAHMTSNTMTGTQYKKYVEMGMGGLPVDEIDPSLTYNKREEAVNNGFIPFMPDDATYMSLVGSNAVRAPGKIGQAIGNLRETLTPDYGINYNGGSISGREFDKKAPAFVHQWEYDYQFNPDKYLSRPKSGDNYTTLINEYTVPDVDGRETYHYGRMTDVPVENDDGTYTISFSDGSDVVVSPDYIKSLNGFIPNKRVRVEDAKGELPEDLDSLNDYALIAQNMRESGGSPLDYADVLFVPDLVLSDGSRMSVEDAQRIYYDKTPDDDPNEDFNDDDITYDFENATMPLLSPLGPLPIPITIPFIDNRPQRLGNQEVFGIGDNGGITVDASNLGNNVMDWTLGSIPISLPGVLPWLNSLSNGSQGIVGVDPSTYDPDTGASRLTDAYYDEEGNLRYGILNPDGTRNDELTESKRWSNTFGNAIVPLSENIVGPIGSSILPFEKVTERLLGKAGDNATVAQVLGNAIAGMGAEGFEEVLGNLFEGLTNNGVAGMFADDYVDASGNPVRDIYGNVAKDYGTPIGKRISNFFNPADLANAFTGGALVDAAMQAVPFIGDLAPAFQRDMARRKTGVRQFVEPEEARRRAVSDLYSRSFEDENEVPVEEYWIPEGV